MPPTRKLLPTSRLLNAMTLGFRDMKCDRFLTWVDYLMFVGCPAAPRLVSNHPGNAISARTLAHTSPLLETPSLPPSRCRLHLDYQIISPAIISAVPINPTRLI